MQHRSGRLPRNRRFEDALLWYKLKSHFNRIGCPMAARSIASLSLSFGLVSIPVKLYSATESSSSVGFNLLHTCGSRVKQQYLCIKENIPVERADMVKGYEFEKDRYVMFAPAELQLARQLIEQISEETYDPGAFKDEERERILAAIDDKIAGKQIVSTEGQEPSAGGQIIDLTEALRASLAPRKAAAKAAPAPAAAPAAAPEAKERKAAKRAAPAEVAAEPAPRVRARK